MDKFQFVITPEVKIMKTTCKSCGKETIFNDVEIIKDIKRQITVEDFVIKEQYCECCDCNFYEVAVSTLLHMTHIK